MYAFQILRSMEAQITGSSGATFASINKGDIEKIRIPLPPLEVQKEIVAEIKGYQKVIENAQAEINHFEKKIQDAIGRVWGTAPQQSDGV